MKLSIEQHKRNDKTRGMQYDTATYVEGYNPAHGTSRAKLIIVDDIEYCVSIATRNIGVWFIESDCVVRASRLLAHHVRTILYSKNY